MWVDSCESMINPLLVKLDINYDAHLLFNTMYIYYAHQVLDKLSMWTIQRMKSCQISLCASYIMQVFDRMSLWMSYDQVHMVIPFKFMPWFISHAIESWGYPIPENLAVT